MIEGSIELVLGEASPGSRQNDLLGFQTARMVGMLSRPSVTEVIGGPPILTSAVH